MDTNARRKYIKELAVLGAVASMGMEAPAYTPSYSNSVSSGIPHDKKTIKRRKKNKMASKSRKANRR